MSVAKERLWLGVILAVTFLVYANSLGNGYTYDDKHYVSAYTMQGPNPLIVEDVPLSDFFEKPMGHGVAQTSRGFRPLTVMSYAFTHHMVRSKLPQPRRHPDFPERPIQQDWTDPAWPHHVLNLLLHLLATFLVYRMLRVFAGPGLAALGGAAVFGLHALRSDQVIAIVGRGELLPFVFGAAGTLLFLRAMQREGGGRWGLVAATFGCSLGAFLSKESSVGWIVMMPLFTAFALVKGGRTWRDAWRPQVVPWVVASLVPAVIFFVLRARMFELAGVAERFLVAHANNRIYDFDLLERLPTAVMVWGVGLLKLLVPYPLSADYSHATFEVIGWGDWRFWLAAVVLLAVLAGGLLAWRRAPLLFLGSAMFFGFSFITSNIPIPIETIFGERLFYTPGLGLSFVVAWLLARGARSVPWLIGAWLVFCCGVIVVRTFDWRSNETLFEADADNQPRSIGMQMNMARVSRLRQDWLGRDRYLDRALAIDPEALGALNDRAADCLSEGRFRDAKPWIERAVQVVSKNAKDLKTMGPEVIINLAFAHQALDELGEARAAFERVVSLYDPERQTRAEHDARAGLCWLAWRGKDLALLRRHVDTALSRFAQSDELRIYKELLAHQGGDAAALDRLEAILRRVPQSVHTALGHQLLIERAQRAGKVDEAMQRSLRLGALLHQMRRGGDAEVALRQCIRHPKFRNPAFRLLGWIAWSKGPAAVETLLKEAEAAAPGDQAMQVHHGLLALEKNDPRRAISILGPILPRLPRDRDSLRAWLALTRAHQAVGELHVVQQLLGQFMDPKLNLPSEYRREFAKIEASLATRKNP